MVRFLVIGAVAALCAVGAVRALDAAGKDRAPTPAVAVATVAPSVATPATGEASIAKSSDGHFWADAQVDGHPVRFLIDTGATAVALTPQDAANLGLNPNSLDYAYTVMTANGRTRAAQVSLGEVSVGGAQVTNVQAFVFQSGLETSLLGMTYLGRLSKIETTPDSMNFQS